jgi:hypothetical protein
MPSQPDADGRPVNLDHRGLASLSGLLRIRHAIDDEVARLIGRPPTTGGIGEVVAAAIFDIELAPTSVTAGFDGRFASGDLKGQTVNVKAYSQRDWMLDISPFDCDWYLVLMGPKRASADKGRALPFRIATVHLFDIRDLKATLEDRGVGVGIASSVRKGDWEPNEVYPDSRSRHLVLTETQRELIRLFEGWSPR